MSLGFNCEVSFALKHMGLFEASPFAWADIRGTDALLKGINNFNEIYNKGAKQYGGNMFFCESTGIGFHGRLKFSEALNEVGETDQLKILASLDDLKSRLNYLENKQESILKDGSVLVILKFFSDIFKEKYSPIESVKLIDLAIQNKYKTNDFKILCVTNSESSDYRHDDSRYFFRTLRKFSPRSNASEIDKIAWEELLREFLEVKEKNMHQNEQLKIAD